MRTRHPGFFVLPVSKSPAELHGRSDFSIPTPARRPRNRARCAGSRKLLLRGGNPYYFQTWPFVILRSTLGVLECWRLFFPARRGKAMKLSLLLTVPFALLAGQQLAKAQSCTDLTPVQAYCTGYKCQGVYSQAPPCQGGIYHSCEAVYIFCCGHRVWVDANMPCTSGMLGNPITRKAIDQMTDDGIQIAVVGCTHHIALYRPVLERPVDSTDIVPLLSKPLGL